MKNSECIVLTANVWAVVSFIKKNRVISCFWKQLCIPDTDEICKKYREQSKLITNFGSKNILPWNAGDCDSA